MLRIPPTSFLLVIALAPIATAQTPGGDDAGLSIAPATSAHQRPPHVFITDRLVNIVSPASDATTSQDDLWNATLLGTPGGARLQQAPTTRDSVKDGLLIGAAVGGLTGFLAGVVGCAAGSITSMRTNPECGGAYLRGTGVGAGLGALLGVGIDAMSERAPHPLAAPSMRKGIRVRWQF